MTDARSAEAFKAGDAASYDAVADQFEHYTERFTLPMATRMVQWAGVSDGARVLDVGCGTGIVSRLMAQQLSAAGEVVGIDLSDGMLAKARRLVAAEGMTSRVELQKADAEHLPFADGRFDAVLSLYALRHFPDPAKALREMWRVGRPGSVAVVGIGSSAPFPSWALCANAWHLLMERARGLWGAGALHATAFLDHLIAKHGGQVATQHGTADAVGDLAGAMRQAGYRDVQVQWVGQTGLVGSPADFWGLQVTLSTRARKALPEMGSARVEALWREFEERCRDHLAQGGTLVYRSGALLARGVRPS
jgi:ubiquinone/menaquinone biosynthesis C-methylase UbiE